MDQRPRPHQEDRREPEPDPDGGTHARPIPRSRPILLRGGPAVREPTHREPEEERRHQRHRPMVIGVREPGVHHVTRHDGERGGRPEPDAA